MTVPPDDIFVPDKAAAAEFERVIRDVRAEESARRWKTIGVTVTPWFLSVVFGGFAVCCLAIVAARPVPQDRIHIAILHDNNSYDAPVPREDLTASRQEVLIKNTVFNFIQAWENYTYTGNQVNYDRVTFMTAGTTLQKRYQNSWNDPQDPEYRDKLYGPNMTRFVLGIDTTLPQGSPHAFESTALIRTRRGAEPAKCSYWSIRGTFRSEPALPIEKQIAIDPAGLVFDTYESSELKTIEASSACR